MTWRELIEALDQIPLRDLDKPVWFNLEEDLSVPLFFNVDLKRATRPLTDNDIEVTINEGDFYLS